jgi:hypothetical protein
MGHSVTPKYALDIFETRMVEGRFQTVKAVVALAWNIKSYGRPTPSNLEKFVRAYGKSLELGGANEGISKDLGYVPYPNRAVISFNHSHGKPVCTWVAPTFMVW